jgi:teichuronic acid biosynthesis glycosyltransferase TuaC
VTTGADGRPRIAVVTPAFPNSAEPYRGIFNYFSARALQPWAEVMVHCIVPAYPSARWLRPRGRTYARIDAAHVGLPGVAVSYHEYPALPFVTRTLNSRTCARRLRQILERQRPDLILAYWLHPEGTAAVRVGNALGIPVVVTALGSDLKLIPDPLTRRQIRKTLRRADYVLAVSDDLRRSALELGASPTRLRTIRNGCDAGVFHLQDRAPARLALGIPKEAEFLLFVGRLAVVKGPDVLLEAFAGLAAARPALQLTCIGEGPLAESLARRAAAPDLRERVRFVPRQTPEEVARWLAAANLLCLPSRSEGCPNVVVEALNCGRPVVGSRVGGVPELLDASCGILVPAGDPRALADALESALRREWDAAEIARLGGRTWDDVGRETYEVCRTVLAERAASLAGPGPTDQST